MVRNDTIYKESFEDPTEPIGSLNSIIRQIKYSKKYQ